MIAVFASDDLHQFLRCFFAAAGKPFLDDSVKALPEEFDMIIDKTVAKALFGQMRIILHDLILTVIAKLEVSAVQDLVVINMMK